MTLAKTPQSAIVYGAPKSGKTKLMVASLATKFNVLYIDCERGVTTLMKLPEEVKKRVEVISIRDIKEEPNAINTCLLLASGKQVNICEAHGKSKCGPCRINKLPSIKVSLDDMKPEEWVVVFDSFTQITSSAQAHVCTKLDLEKDKMNFDHLRHQWVLLERFLDYLQNSRYNCVLITHEMGIEQADGTEKIQPCGGTKNFARNVPKYFDHIIYCSVKNHKHIASSVTTAHNKVLTGSRTETAVDMNDPDSVCALFGK